MDLPDVFQLTEVVAIMPATMLSALVLGGGSLIGLSLAGHSAVGLGLCLGLIGGGVSNRVFQRSTSRIAANPQGRVGRQVGSRTLSRLAVLTVAALLLVAFARPVGVGVIAGLALFQFVLLMNIIRVLFKLRKGAA